MKQLTNLIFITICLLTICSCARDPNTIAEPAGLHQAYIQTEVFKLASYQRLRQAAAPINIYIEGDGHAFCRYKVSNDPSPHQPTMLQIAALDPNPNVVYLARPCQYSAQDLKTVCDAKYWTYARYSATVVNAIDQAITKIKQQSQKINLIGFSGGGTIVVLIAAQRHDVASIRTIAGNLDLIAMQNYHHTTPLYESLDPITVAAKVKNIPQLHFVGAKDHVVPTFIAKNFCQAAGIDPKHVIVLPTAGHHNGWASIWPELLKRVPEI